MSFLNPVNEPVLRFKSTDTGAPQINYNARAAGDVKAVLKACLVTGYGSTSSAGWSIVNEVDHVAEFVSPSAAMSDYRLGINDTSAASTTWYYQYQDARVNPTYNAPSKMFDYVDKNNAANGWQLLVTDYGFCFVEILYSPAVQKTVARLTYFGLSMSNFKLNAGQTMSFWCVGASAKNPVDFFKDASQSYNVVNNTSCKIVAANINYAADRPASGSSANENLAASIVAPIYLESGRHIIGQLTPFYLCSNNNLDAKYGVYDDIIDDMPFLSVCVVYSESTAVYYELYARIIKIRTDKWVF